MCNQIIEKALQDMAVGLDAVIGRFMGETNG
jgi:hypothetical protein